MPRRWSAARDSPLGVEHEHHRLTHVTRADRLLVIDVGLDQVSVGVVAVVVVAVDVELLRALAGTALTDDDRGESTAGIGGRERTVSVVIDAVVGREHVSEHEPAVVGERGRIRLHQRFEILDVHVQGPWL
jgi:hypothetical protein